MVLKSATASGSQPTAMPFFFRQFSGTLGIVESVETFIEPVLVGMPPVAVSTDEESMTNDRVGLLVRIEGPERVPVGYGLKPVPETPVGPRVGPPYVVVG